MSHLEDPRVLFAAERTLLAWNRTSLALIGFGFVIDRAGLLFYMGFSSQMAPLISYSIGSLILGLTFILVGIFTAFYSARQYSRVLSTLSAKEFPQGYQAKWGMGVNIMVAVLGIALSFLLLFTL